MNRRTLIATAGTALAALLPMPLAAQEGTRTLTIRPLEFQLREPLEDVYAHSVTAPPDAPDAGGVPVEVKRYLNHEAGSLALSGDRVIFTTEASRESITQPDKVIGRLAVPADLRSAILLFLPGDGKPGSPKTRILPVDDTTQAFPRGSFQIFNLSPQPVQIILGGETHNFRPGDKKVIKDPPVNERNSIGMKAFTFVDGERRRIASSDWPHPGSKREVLLLYMDSQSGKIQMRGVKDVAVRDPE